MPGSGRPPPNELDNHLTSMGLIQVRLAHGANVNARLKTMQPYRTKLDRADDTMLDTGTTPMLRPAKAGDVRAMQTLLAKGGDVKLPTKLGFTPLMASAGLGSKGVDATGRTKTEAEAIASIKLCPQAGADVNGADSQGQTALHGAAEWGWDRVVQFLVDHGAKLDVKDKRGAYATGCCPGLLSNGDLEDGPRRASMRARRRCCAN
jgi:ankyrin repeat protein